MQRTESQYHIRTVIPLRGPRIETSGRRVRLNGNSGGVCPGPGGAAERLTRHDWMRIIAGSSGKTTWSSTLTQSTRPTVSLIVPTYREAENLPELIAAVGAMRERNGLCLELLIMDDDSRDGTDEAVAQIAAPWVRLIVRKANRGLSAAVLDGFLAATNEILLVMDADLSHPPEAIPALVDAIAAGADFAIGSRYVAGGTTDEEWGVFRWLNSRVATLLARPFTAAKDPMSGFFALRRETFTQAAPLSPIGYKIGLELIVKCRCKRIVEIPIHFAQRQRGQSKLTLKEQLRYLQHLRRLFVFKFGNWAHFAQFAAVGTSGVAVNLAALTVLVWLLVPLRLAAALAIFIAMLTNFVLNRWITFSYARGGHFWWQMAGFIGASSFGAVVNYAVILITLYLWPVLETVPQVASLLGILAGLTFNYFASRYFVFRTPEPRA